jgi:UDP-GlcNAc3NAcA epimerase
MLNIITVVGARPQFIKASALSRAILGHFSDRIREKILHTGQHYDDKMSKIFFTEMGIPEPQWNLAVGSGNHGEMTAGMIKGIEEILLKENPDAVIVFGDTNSTLAAAMAASKLHIPIAHIEAGLRSFNKSMPEEINRILTDHVSTFLFSPTQGGIDNLVKEGFAKNAHAPFNIDNPLLVHSGDLMYDNALYFAGSENDASSINEYINSDYVLMTLHRESNTKDINILNGILDAMKEISRAEQMPVIWPVHPGTRKIMKENNIVCDPLIVIEPVSYLEMLQLERNCKMIVTDSGGMQKEAYFHKCKCLILREETEWVELVRHGTAEIAGTDKDGIVKHYNILRNRAINNYPELYGTGHAAEYCCKVLLENL